MLDRVVGRPEARGPLRQLLILASIAIVLAWAQAVHGLLALIAFSGLAAILARAFQLWLVRRGVGTMPAVVLTVLAYVVILGLLGAAAVASVLAVASQLSADTGRMDEAVAQLAAGFASATGIPPGSVPTPDTRALVDAVRQLLATAAPTAAALAMSVLIVVYLLIDASALRARMLAATSADAMRRFDSLAAELVVYIRVRAVLGGAAAIADTLLLLALGVPFAVLWGVVSFLFSFVPNIGFILALVPPTVFALVELGPLPALLVVVGYVLINLAFDYVLQPRMIASSLDLSPVVVIVSILVWTEIIGPAGALLAVPLTIALRVLLAPFDGARWFVALLGPIPGESPGERPAASSPTLPTIEPVTEQPA
jgi:AI-2 transport protein TqsA